MIKENVKIIAEVKVKSDGTKVHAKNLTTAEGRDTSFIVSGEKMKVHEHEDRFINLVIKR